MIKRQYLFLSFVVLVAALLRLWNLGKVPPSPDWDEVALGYNAYSILETGRDEYGKFLPVVLRSFDDYKPALYTYLAIPSIKIFGLNTFAVRLPSAILGILTVLATYFLVVELFGIKSQTNIKDKKITTDALISALLLAISPWHIQFSRIAFEANVGLAFNIFGLLFFLKGLRRNNFLFLSALFYALSLYTYQSEKVFVPLIIAVLLVIFRRQVLKNIKQAFFAGLFFTLLVFPLIFVTFANPDALLRAKGVSVFADQTPFLAKSAERLTRDYKKNDYLGLILDNRRVTYILAFFNGYLSHFDFNWLFITGDQPRHQPPNFGHLYLFELPFLFFGIYTLVFGKFPRELKQFIFLWFLITPVPASLTTGVPHPIRTLNFLPTFQIFTAIGILAFLRWLQALQIKKAFQLAVFALNFALLTFNFLYYFNQYFVQQNYFRSDVWQYGYRQAVEVTEAIKGRYKKIVVTNKPHLDQSYMFFLFYTKYDPKLYLAKGGTKSGGFAEVNSFSKYIFRPIDWEKEGKKSDVLFVGRPEDFPLDVASIETINFLNGKPAIRIVEGR